MAYFYALRGWIEVDPDNYKQVVDVIDNIRDEVSNDEQYSLYIKGWCWNNRTINWTGYIFYGADVKEHGVSFLIETLENLINLKVGLSGFFHAEGEDGAENQTFRLMNDVLSVENSSPLIEISE